MSGILSGFGKPFVPPTPTLIGAPVVDFTNVRETVEHFYALYQLMPFSDNAYGMQSSHLFLFWTALNQMKPKTVLESGVYKGLGTWWIEQACPDAEIYCIDIDYSNVEYKSSRAVYLTEDFASHTWEEVPRDTTLIFFDDHQNALLRLMQMRWMGFRHAIFDDNYAPYTGDCYSCKKMLAETGNQWSWDIVEPNRIDGFFLRQNIECYQQFPPVFCCEKTRFGFPWSEQALLEQADTPAQELLLRDASAYTYMCSVRLRG